MLLPEEDPRIAKWFLMRNRTAVSIIVISYLVFVKILGPLYMKNREPYSLKKIIIIYNFGMVAYSGWMFYKFGKHGWFGKYNWLCEPINYAVDEDSMGMVLASWHFFFSKLVELLDTVFFVLRKKYTQVTFLHVVHHALMPFFSQYVLGHGASGFNTFSGLINTFVHIIMYSYYGLSALGPFMQKYLWWKKYLTTLQMMQFCLIIGMMVNHAVRPGCETNLVLIANHMGLCFLFLVLFANFYIHSYQKKPKVKSEGQE